MNTTETWDFAKAVEELAHEKSRLPSLTERELVGQAMAAEGDLGRLREIAEHSARQAVLAVLLAGYALQELKKRVSKKQAWVAFINEHLVELSQASIYRYLKVAKRFPDPKSLPMDISIMVAHRLCGVIKGTKPSAAKKADVASATDADTPPPPPPGEDFPDRIRGIAQFFGGFDAGHVVAATEPDCRQALAEEIGALVKVLGRIHAALLKPLVTV